MGTRISSTNLLIIGVATFFAGWMFLGNVRLKWSSSNWESVQGQIVSSGVRHGRGAPTAQVEYAYRVNDSTYSNDRLSLGDGLPSAYGGPDDFAQRNPPGTPIVVYYDPRNPKMSALSTEGSVGGNLFLVLLSWFFSGASLYSVFRSRREYG